MPLWEHWRRPAIICGEELPLLFPARRAQKDNVTPAVPFMFNALLTFAAVMYLPLVPVAPVPFARLIAFPTSPVVEAGVFCHTALSPLAVASSDGVEASAKCQTARKLLLKVKTEVALALSPTPALPQ